MRPLAFLVFVILPRITPADLAAQSAAQLHPLGAFRYGAEPAFPPPQRVQAGRCPAPKVAIAAAGGGLVGMIGGHVFMGLVTLGGLLSSDGDEQADLRRGRPVGAVLGSALVASLAVHRGADC